MVGFGGPIRGARGGHAHFFVKNGTKISKIIIITWITHDQTIDNIASWALMKNFSPIRHCQKNHMPKYGHACCFSVMTWLNMNNLEWNLHHLICTIDIQYMLKCLIYVQKTFKMDKINHFSDRIFAWISVVHCSECLDFYNFQYFSWNFQDQCGTNFRT